MTKRDISILLSPTIILVAFAIFAFCISAQIRRDKINDGGQQTFDRFVDNVQSGKWPVTTDRLLEAMRRQHDTFETYRKAGADLGDIMLWLGWASILGVYVQVAVVLHVRKRLRKP